MATDSHTSERTSLGLVLQHMVEDCLSDEGIQFVANCSYFPNFIKPDVLIPGAPPKYSIHVTATGADNSFQMKRWRYIDEVMQMRSIWGNDFVAVNLLFGPIAGYQVGDRQLLQKLFDQEVIVHDFDQMDYVYHKAIAAIGSATSGERSRQVATKLLQDVNVKSIIYTLGKELKKIVDSGMQSAAHPASCRQLKKFLATRQRHLKSNVPSISGRAAWKRSALRILAISPQYWDQLYRLQGKEVPASRLDPRMILEASRAKLLKVREGAAGIRNVSLNDELNLTIRAGLTLQMMQSIHSVVSVNPRRRFELEDLWDGGVRAAAAVTEVANAFGQGASALVELVAHSILHGGSKSLEHHRTHVLDVVLSAIGISQNQLQDRYRGPGIGVMDPVRNLVPRTELAVQSIKNGKLNVKDAATGLVNSVWTELSAIAWDDIQSLKEKYVNLRVFNLVKGSSIDPLEDYIEAELLGAGWILEESKFASQHPFVGTVKTDFSAIASKNGKLLLLKCLFGDTGADHKSEEMEARMRILRLSASVEIDLVTIFIADGNWSQGNLECLVLGGWDHVIPVSQFRATLTAL